MTAQRPPDVKETRHYIARMCREMRDMARNIDLPMLAYLLDMARIEADPDEGNTEAR
ncbi:hypothetical protein [Breoghania sp. JC706]|uniref:hypothetical protein n=1 Tax=Breoghania sp. JC706 TaxID=3117732 RepID=UPI0030084E47